MSTLVRANGANPFGLPSPNPFLMALSDADWRTLRSKLKRHPHLFAINAELFLQALRPSLAAQARFEHYCSSRTADVESVLRDARSSHARANVFPFK
jgi:hypothetical protein